MPPRRRYWLMKSEPSVFSIQDLARAPKKTTEWEGVRNYQARNLLRDEIRKGDGVLFHHSNAKPPAIVGTATVVKEGYPDFHAWDPRSKYFDPKSTQDAPRWFMVDIKLERIFEEPLGLDWLREQKALSEMMLLRKGARLSVQPVTAKEWKAVIAFADRKR